MDATIPHMATVDGVEKYLDAVEPGSFWTNQTGSHLDTLSYLDEFLTGFLLDTRPTTIWT
jgi:hypothetical protein